MARVRSNHGRRQFKVSYRHKHSASTQTTQKQIEGISLLSPHFQRLEKQFADLQALSQSPLQIKKALSAIWVLSRELEALEVELSAFHLKDCLDSTPYSDLPVS